MISTPSDLSQCSVSGCTKRVTKAGHSLCYEHWRTASPKAITGDAALSTKTADIKPQKTGPLLNSTQLGEKLSVSGQRINLVLSELGWIEREKKGWMLTAQGKKLRAEQKEHSQTGIPFVLWPEAILTSRILTATIRELSEAKVAEPAPCANTKDAPEAKSNFRTKFEATHRATDGHWVRSKAEALIDNWLYMSGLVHAYERQLPVEEELYCDFYIPSGKVYIEYWGMESDPKYQARKEVKKSIYAKYGFNLIELTDEHVKNIDDFLPKLLLKYNVIVS